MFSSGPVPASWLPGVSVRDLRVLGICSPYPSPSVHAISFVFTRYLLRFARWCLHRLFCKFLSRGVSCRIPILQSLHRRQGCDLTCCAVVEMYRAHAAHDCFDRIVYCMRLKCSLCVRCVVSSVVGTVFFAVSFAFSFPALVFFGEKDNC